jgi:hypothetical protein
MHPTPSAEDRFHALTVASCPRLMAAAVILSGAAIHRKRLDRALKI